MFMDFNISENSNSCCAISCCYMPRLATLSGEQQKKFMEILTDTLQLQQPAHLLPLSLAMRILDAAKTSYCTPEMLRTSTSLCKPLEGKHVRY